MKRFEIIVVVLICCGLYAANLHAESQKSPAGNNTKQQEEIVPEHTQTEQQFKPAECFDKVWRIINEEFWDPNFNGVDWEDAGKRYRPKALAPKGHKGKGN